MKDILLWAIFIALFTALNLQAQQVSIAPNLQEEALINHLRSNYYPQTPRDYDVARDSMYQYLDVDVSDSLTCVYTGLRAKADGSRTPSNGALSFNTEHSWPQSFYDGAEPMRGDIHHLFPVWSSVNSSRGNNPFAEIDDNNTTSWWYWKNSGSQSSIPTTEIDEYSEYYNNSFEPREDHKGNAARAMFYFWTMYQTNNDIITDTFDNEAFFNGMKHTLYAWHKQDPVDAEELARTNAIESIQGNSNPFVKDSSLVRRAFFYVEPTSETTLPEVFISEVYEANGGTVKYLELFNTTDSTINFTSENWSLFRFSNANTTGIEINLSGTIESKSFFVIGNDNSTNGVQTLFGEGIVNQNTSQINHNGNDKYALVKNTQTAPDTIDWFGKDNIGNSSAFASNQVLYRVFERLPNSGTVGQTNNSSDGDTTSSGFWRAFNIFSNNSNGKLVGSPGYNKGYETNLKPQALLTGNAGWRIISIPGNNTNLNELKDDIAIQGIENDAVPNVFLYNSSGSYSTPTTLNSTIENGSGILVYVFNNDTLGSRSLPNVVDISTTEPTTDVTVTLNTSVANGGSYFTLVGNPYQSNYLLSSLSSNQNVQENIHVLENGLYSTESISNSIVMPWQGFWIESAIADAASQLTFPVSGKTNSVASVQSYSKIVDQPESLTLNLETSSGLDKGCRIEFNTSSIIGWDRFDASKIHPTKPSFGILGCLQNENSKSVLSLPYHLDESIEIGLFVNAVQVSNMMSLNWDLPPTLAEQFNFILTNIATQEQFIINEIGSKPFTYNHKKASQNVSLGFNPSILSKAKPNTEDVIFILSISPKITTSNEIIGLPSDFTLAQNYPNPFNPSTSISYSIPSNGMVVLEVRNSLGQLVATLVNEHQNAGNYSASFNATALSSGIYFYTLETVNFSITKKMLLIK